MRFLSVCSGIEAASVAWHPLGWECAAVAEVDPFPSAVLAHHYPSVPNLGDITAPDFTEKAHARGPVQLLVGGTPCQSFSVAGLRKGLADPRGGLTLRFLEIARDLRPRWVVWENVPGVLSADGGRAFGAFLGGLAELGYGWAYRVLDAQFFGVPQRRRRVFVVGCLGDWTAAAAVLLERHSLSGDPPPSREKGAGTSAGVAPSLTGSGRGVERTGESRGQDPVVAVGGGVDPARHLRERESRVPDVAWCLQERDAKGADSDTKPGHLIPEGGCFDAPGTKVYDMRGNGTGDLCPTISASAAGDRPSDFAACAVEPLGFDRAQITSAQNYSNPKPGDPQPPLNTAGQGMVAAPSVYSPTDSAAGRYEGRPVTTPVTASRDPSRVTPLAVDAAEPQAFDPYNHAIDGDVTSTLGTNCGAGSGSRQGVMEPFALSIRGREGGAAAEVEPGGVAPAQRSPSGGGSHTFVAAPSPMMRVRRLTPRECERLQGFPDDYSRIPWKGKDPGLCPDGPRYRALGNSMAVPVMRWIGERIQMVEEVLNQRRGA